MKQLSITLAAMLGIAGPMTGSAKADDALENYDHGRRVAMETSAREGSEKIFQTLCLFVLGLNKDGPDSGVVNIKIDGRPLVRQNFFTEYASVSVYLGAPLAAMPMDNQIVT